MATAGPTRTAGGVFKMELMRLPVNHRSGLIPTTMATVITSMGLREITVSSAVVIHLLTATDAWIPMEIRILTQTLAA